MRETVSVIIPTYNRRKYVSEAVGSVLAQSHPPYQVIVVNDGSTDGTEQVLKSFGDRIELLTKENGGKSTALNLAMEHVRGDFVWIFDDDDVALPDTLEQLVRALRPVPDAGFAYGTYHWAKTDASGRLVRQKVNPLPQVAANDLFVRMMESCFISLNTCLVRRACYEAVGNFDARQVRSQDYEMLLRLCRRFDGIAVHAPLMLVRDHDGLRGSAAQNHDARDRSKAHLVFDQMAFRKLYDTLPLEEYLPKLQRGDISLPHVRRQALIQRACIMARRALWDWAGNDIIAAVEAYSGPLSETERRVAELTFAVPTTILRPPGMPYFARLHSALRKASQWDLAAAFAKGLYWNATGHGRAGRRISQVRALAYLATVLGPVGLVAMADTRLGLRRFKRSSI